MCSAPVRRTPSPAGSSARSSRGLPKMARFLRFTSSRAMRSGKTQTSMRCEGESTTPTTQERRQIRTRTRSATEVLRQVGSSTIQAFTKANGGYQAGASCLWYPKNLTPSAKLHPLTHRPYRLQPQTVIGRFARGCQGWRTTLESRRICSQRTCSDSSATQSPRCSARSISQSFSISETVYIVGPLLWSIRIHSVPECEAAM